MNKRISTAVAVPVAATALGAAFVWMGLTRHGFWHPTRGPLDGFYPAVMGAFLVVAGIVGIVQSLREESPVFEPRNWYIPLSTGLVIAFTYLIGILPAVGIYNFVWLKFIHKASWRTTLIYMAVVALVVYGVFIVWLSVPFERGWIHAWMTRY